MNDIRRSTKYVRDSSGRVVLQRSTDGLIRQPHPASNNQHRAEQTADKAESAKPKKHRKLSFKNPFSKPWNYLGKKIQSFSKLSLIKKLSLSGLVIAVGVAGAVTIINTRTKSSTIEAPPAEGSNAIIENLEYQTILPGGRSIGELGGWKRVSPAKSDPVYAFNDSIAGIDVSVSQQPIPGSFLGDVEQGVAKLAKEYNAVNTLSAGGAKVYIGNSTKGPQSTIFTKNNLLILIKSKKKIADSDWIAYIESLN